MSKQFWAIVAIIVLAFGAIIAFGGNKSDDTNSAASSSSSSKLTEHIKGNPDAKVTLVEYGDFQCPYCQQYEPTIKQVLDKYQNDIKFQFRNFPLINIHQNAFAAARAAEAAGLQNKYWEMHDALYDQANWQTWTTANAPQAEFNTYAKELGLDVEQFKKDFSSSTVNDAVNADQAEGNRLKITGTPSFFINGKKVEISNSLASFEKVIDEALAKAQPAATNPAQ